MTNRVISFIVFGILTLLWLAFAAALVFNRALLLNAWQTLRGWPLILQLVIWLLTLPVTLGLWVWQTSWPVILRIILVIGLAWVTLFTFFPRRKVASETSLSRSTS